MRVWRALPGNAGAIRHQRQLGAMNVALYKAVRFVGGLIFRVASRRTVLHPERGRFPSGCILAANHGSPFDVPLLVVTTWRPIHGLSIVDLSRNPFWRWFLTAYGALPLDRSKPAPATTRRLVRLLKQGAMVGMFPEGRF